MSYSNCWNWCQIVNLALNFEFLISFSFSAKKIRSKRSSIVQITLFWTLNTYLSNLLHLPHLDNLGNHRIFENKPKLFHYYSWMLDKIVRHPLQSNLGFRCTELKWNNSILLHSGLNPAWHFWLSTRFSCCLKMK